MSQELKAIFKDKRLLAGVGIAAAVGLVVFIRRQQSGTASTAATAPSSGGFYTGTGYADTTTSDMASYLSSWGNAMLDAVRAGQASTQVATTTTATTGEGVQLLSATDFTTDGPWRRYTWAPVAGATSYAVTFAGDPRTYTVTDPVADWHYPAESGGITVTPQMASWSG